MGWIEERVNVYFFPALEVEYFSGVGNEAHVVPHTIPFKVVCCSGGPGLFGFALKDCKFCA